MRLKRDYIDIGLSIVFWCVFGCDGVGWWIPLFRGFQECSRNLRFSPFWTNFSHNFYPIFENLEFWGSGFIFRVQDCSNSTAQTNARPITPCTYANLILLSKFEKKPLKLKKKLLNIQILFKSTPICVSFHHQPETIF